MVTQSSSSFKERAELKSANPRLRDSKYEEGEERGGEQRGRYKGWANGSSIGEGAYECRRKEGGAVRKTVFPAKVRAKCVSTPTLLSTREPTHKICRQVEESPIRLTN